VSGGSYEYIAWKEVEALFERESVIQQMADRLAGLGYAEDAARETTELLLMIRQARVRIETRQRRLEDVWKAVEWWDSADSGEEDVKEALAVYRGEK
jgi:hypothetical protein